MADRPEIVKDNWVYLIFTSPLPSPPKFRFASRDSSGQTKQNKTWGAGRLAIGAGFVVAAGRAPPFARAIGETLAARGAVEVTLRVVGGRRRREGLWPKGARPTPRPGLGTRGRGGRSLKPRLLRHFVPHNDALMSASFTSPMARVTLMPRGQASTQLKTVRQRQTPSEVFKTFRRSSFPSSRLSKRNRWAWTIAAGPT